MDRFHKIQLEVSVMIIQSQTSRLCKSYACTCACKYHTVEQTNRTYSGHSKWYRSNKNQTNRYIHARINAANGVSTVASAIKWGHKTEYQRLIEPAEEMKVRNLESEQCSLHFLSKNAKS